MRAPWSAILLLPAALLAGCAGRLPTVDTPQVWEGNDYPIVLVHGVMGYGRDEMFGFKCWGGFVDLQEELRKAGHQTFTAAVGPISSNWDRACELYACIKGGRVDYGEAHARKFGHDRYGRSYPGLYPQWGETDPRTGTVRKIHIVGHSLGGPTARMLIQLLEQGAPEQSAASRGDHPLFQGGKSWVCSLTTISSPHDGTTYVYKWDWDRSLIKPVLTLLISMSSSSPELYYDFKLDQWGLARRPGERFSTYRDRVVASEIWSQTRDTASWDASPEGAMELNSWVRAQPGVYYFSWATEATYRDPLSGFEVPEISLLATMAPKARFMGSYTREGGDLPIDRSWLKNDGVVNTNSMDGPTLGSRDRIRPYSGTPVRGEWNYMGLLQSVDHLDIIGLPTAERGLTDWYLSLAELLASLPDEAERSPR